MQKTGCTHIARLLQEYVGGRTLQKHARLASGPGDRVVIGSVRDPWDWYVSLWAFGCAGEGALYHLLTNPKFAERASARTSDIQPPGGNHEKWRELYGDPRDVDLYRSWLDFFLSDSGKCDLPEGYAESPLSKFCGFMTYRFVFLYTNNSKWIEIGKSVDDDKKLQEFFEEHNVIDRMVYMENLERDLFQILRDIGYEGIHGIERPRSRTNSSKHLRYQEYYNGEAEDLVAKEEKFIIDRYGYKRPGSAKAEPRQLVKIRVTPRISKP